MNSCEATIPALQLDEVVKGFGGVLALNGVSLDVPSNTIFGIMGPNGAGKTTLLNVVSGLAQATRGSVKALGRDIDGMAAHNVARLGVARTYQNVRLFEGLSVLDTVVAGLWRQRNSLLWQSVLLWPTELRERRTVRHRAAELLDRVGVKADPNRVATTLPYGEQRRTEIARALATSPRLLLLDEPTAGMNRQESRALGELLRTLLDDGISLVLIEHNIKFVLEFCERAAVIDFGTVIAEGTPEECVSDPEVRRAYFGVGRHGS